MDSRRASASLVACAIVGLAVRAEAAGFTRGPYLQDLGSRGVAVLAEIDAAHSAKLEVFRGTEGNAQAAAKAESSAKDTTIELSVSGLEPATTYRWALTLDDGTVERGTFTTAPEDDRPFTFVLYGDNRTNPYAHAAIVAAIRKTPSDFLVHTGDMVYDGSQLLDWKEFFSIERDLLKERCLFPTIGNHEIALPTSDGALRYARMFRVPAPIDAAERWYTFRWGAARFFMLDAHDDFATAERAWLENALKSAQHEPGVVYRFVVTHHGPYSSGLHGGNEAMILGRIPELLRAYDVDVVFSGHDHIYERGDANGLRYVVSGGGGAPLYKAFRGAPTTQKFEATYHFLKLEVNKSAVTMTTIRHDGSILERCMLAAGRATGWGCDGAPKTAQPSTLVSAPTPQPQPPSNAPPAKKSCGCSIVGGGGEWLGLAVAGTLTAAVVVRPRRRRGGRTPPRGEA